MDTTLAARFRMILEEQRLKQTELAEALGSAPTIFPCWRAAKNAGIPDPRQAGGSPVRLFRRMGHDRPGASGRAGKRLRRQAMERIMQMTAEDLLRLKDFIR